MAVRRQRRRYFVDRRVQGALLARIIRYWVICVSLVVLLTILGWGFHSAGIVGFTNFRQQFQGVVSGLMIASVAALLVMPLIIMDLNRLTNRFAGPMYRLRRAMIQLADGKTVEPIRFRTDDYWQEFADAFNRIIVRLERLKHEERTAQVQRKEHAESNGAVMQPLLR